MTAINGTNGQVAVTSNVVAELDNWDATIDATLLDTTAFGVGWHAFIAGLKGASGTASGRWYQGDTNGQAALQAAILGGTTVTLNLSPNGGTNKYSGTAFIKQIQIKAAVAGTVDVTFQFQFTGTVTYA